MGSFWKIVAPWEVLLAGGAVVFSVAFVPWLMGLKWRRKGEQPPGLASQVGAYAAVAIAALFLVPAVSLVLMGAVGLVLMATVDVFWGAGRFVYIALLGAAIIAGGVLAVVRLMKGVKAHVLLIVLVCGISGTVCLYETHRRARNVSKQIKDGAHLGGISRGLLLYYNEHESYPDDLRRLVDEGVVSRGVLMSLGRGDTDRFAEFQQIPYQGPCDFIYIRLPEDAPDDLVWVWQPLEHHKNEGANVLFKKGYVRWQTPGQLCAELARTYEWLLAHPTTQPATAPVR